MVLNASGGRSEGDDPVSRPLICFTFYCLTADTSLGTGLLDLLSFVVVFISSSRIESDFGNCWIPSRAVFLDIRNRGCHVEQNHRFIFLF